MLVRLGMSTLVVRLAATMTRESFLLQEDIEFLKVVKRPVDDGTQKYNLRKGTRG